MENKLSDVPPNEMKECLSNLNRFLEATNEKQPENTWHDTLSNSDLMQQIGDELNNHSLLVI